MTWSGRNRRYWVATIANCNALRQFPHQFVPCQTRTPNWRKRCLVLPHYCTVGSRPGLSKFGSSGLMYTGSAFPPCRGTPRACRMRFEGGKLKKPVYLLLAILSLQLSGVGMVCARRAPARHGCCPAPEKRSDSNQESLPDCCLASLLNYQGSITEAQVPTFDSHSAPVIAKTAALSPSLELPWVYANRRGLYHPPPLAPLSPLLQTCLLLN